MVVHEHHNPVKSLVKRKVLNGSSLGKSVPYCDMKCKK